MKNENDPEALVSSGASGGEAGRVRGVARRAASAARRGL